jgi:hypothetical protein
MAEKLHEQTVSSFTYVACVIDAVSSIFSYAFLISVHLFAVFVIAIIVGKQ